MKSPEALIKQIVENLPEEEWWDDDNQRPLIDLGLRLLALGCSIDEIRAILRGIYSAIYQEIISCNYRL